MNKLPFCLVLLSCAAGAMPRSSSLTLGDLMEDLIRKTNIERTRQGKQALKENGRLVLAAQAFAEDLASRGVLTHIDSKGRGPDGRARAEGYRWASLGENIANGYSTPKAVIRGWMDSAEHRANLLNSDFTEVGVGVMTDRNGKAVWVQMLARPRP